MNSEDFTAIALTLRLALVSTAVLLVLGTPLALWLAMARSRWTAVAEAIVALPLVLPPTVLGFYLLLLLGPQGPIGIAATTLGLQVPAFHFSGLVVGSVIYSLPFVVAPLRDAFRNIDRGLLEVATTLGAGPLERFWRIQLPLARSGFLTATVLGCAHTLGEFGVVLMIGGSIPAETRVASIALYEHVEALAYPRAHMLAGVLLLLSLALLFPIYSRRTRIAWGPP